MWKKTYPYLKDSAFIDLIDNQKIKNQFIKLIVLDWDENPIQEIQGIATGGSISINGNSSVRRTCNLSMIVKKTEDTSIEDVNNLISIGRKLYLEIGISNNTGRYEEEYPIVWFPQGVFIFTQVSLSSSATSNLTLSAQLKDKMCLLNGECGGIFTSQIRFDKWNTVDENGLEVVESPTISTIIREAVNHWGKESLGKILINDIDERYKAVLSWYSSEPLYKITYQGNTILTTNKTEADPDTGKIEYGYRDDIGFSYLDFTYPEELIANPGDNICSAVLDKIKNFLGNFEYFYDIYGNFVFQEIKDYLNTTQATVVINNLNNEDYVIDIAKGKAVYDFSDSKLITSFSNTPQYNRIKNDFVIWGVRKGDNDINIPIRYHLSIDKKPKIGNVYPICLIENEDFYGNIYQEATSPLGFSSFSLFPTVGNSMFFYWDKSNDKIYEWDPENLEYVERADLELIRVITTDWRTELYLQGVEALSLGLEKNYYFAELEAEWPKIYDIAAEENEAGYYEGAFKEEYINHPWEVNYWLDFIDSEAAIGALNVNNIGRRSLSENKTEYNCVFEPEVPDIILINLEDAEEAAKIREECEARNQDYLQVDASIFKNIGIGGFKNSCFERVKNALYDLTSYNNSVSISAIPIYHLEPNTRITLANKENNIFGDYLIGSINIPLDISSTMSISAVKCNPKL